MYYRLNDDVELRGYKGRPYGIYRSGEGEVHFLPPVADSRILFRCNGKNDLDPGMLTEMQRTALEELERTGMLTVTACMNPMLHPIPRKVFPCRYTEGVHWSLTGKCNFNCKHCFQSAPEGVLGEPSLERCLDMIRQFEECGVMRVDLTGGEPLIREDFLLIVDELLARKIAIGCIYSNGWLIDRPFLDALKERKLTVSFQLSFDGVGHHDWMRGVPGAEKRAVEAMKLLKEYGFPFSAAMCLCRENLASAWDTVCLMDSLGCQGMKLQRATPQGEWLRQPEHYLGDEELLEAYMDIARKYMASGLTADLQTEGVFAMNNGTDGKSVHILFAGPEESDRVLNAPSCGILRSNFFLGPNGAAVPCMSMCGSPVEKQFPNAFDTPLAEILRDSALTRLSGTTRRDVTEHNAECRECAYRARCGGGRCRAGATDPGSEDFLAVDAFTCYLFRNRWYERLKAFAESFAGADGEEQVRPELC